MWLVDIIGCALIIIASPLLTNKYYRALLWCWGVLPVLSLMLAYEYASWTGFDQLEGVAHISCDDSMPRTGSRQSLREVSTEVSRGKQKCKPMHGTLHLKEHNVRKGC